MGSEEQNPLDPRVDATRFFVAVAHARYVMRTVTRIVDDLARKESLESLEHQALIQICGAKNGPIRVNELAERLDIVPAFASRLVGSLEGKGLVKRGQDDEDKRVTLLEVTDEGTELLSRVHEQVEVHIGIFKNALQDDTRMDAFRIFGFYVGMPPGLSSGFTD